MIPTEHGLAYSRYPARPERGDPLPTRRSKAHHPLAGYVTRAPGDHWRRRRGGSPFWIRHSTRFTPTNG